MVPLSQPGYLPYMRNITPPPLLPVGVGNIITNGQLKESILSKPPVSYDLCIAFSVYACESFQLYFLQASWVD